METSTPIMYIIHVDGENSDELDDTSRSYPEAAYHAHFQMTSQRFRPCRCHFFYRYFYSTSIKRFNVVPSPVLTSTPVSTTGCVVNAGG
ncbi:hypothetical protein NECAME_03586 [Necator americanus]|uniref:Uncharacterized protein n=1 Tax=Necator americanus TaxID=51031 RepID=W2T1Z4_NECAM|nr:hypothetical protein NECAME_03586 [Necator americanus]ETN76020.1 hypothetical protein NECAME_03586 [Necator americanus]